MLEINTEEKLAPEVLKEYERRYALAYRIGKEALTQLNIPVLPENFVSTANFNWKVFYQDINDNLLLSIDFSSMAARGIIHCSLSLTVMEMSGDLENLLSERKAIDIFDLKASDHDQTLFDLMVGFTKDYISYFPAVIYHSTFQGLKESIITHIKKTIEPELRKHQEQMGSSEKISLLPNNSLEDIRKMFPNAKLLLLEHLENIDAGAIGFRKGACKDRKVFLTEERFRDLYKEYNQVRRLFVKIKKDYKEKEDAFFKINRKPTKNDDWNEYWNDHMLENYPNIRFSKYDFDRTPAELAYIYLAERYSYHHTTIESKVQESKRLSERKRRNSKR